MKLCKNINILLLPSLVSIDSEENCQNGDKGKDKENEEKFIRFQGYNLLPNKTVCVIQNTDRIYGGVQTDLGEHPWTVLIKYNKQLQQMNGIGLLPNKTVCGIQNNDRIVGGMLTDLDEHPWMVLIKYDKPKGSSFSCGGVLISSRYVMTAAHCVKDLPQDWKLSQVRLGEWNLTSKIDCQLDDCSADPLNVDVEESIAHEDYNSTGQNNDIALLRLVQDIPYSDFVKPICLPTGPALIKKSFEAYTMDVAGWGKTETRLMSDVKLRVQVTVRNNQDCQKVYSRTKLKITENQLCAGGLEGQDSCRGDSGGALMGKIDNSNRWIAVGVVSYGPSTCGIPGWPGVYTRVTSYVDWILSKIRP